MNLSRKRISNSNEEENVPPEAKFMGMYLSPFLLFIFYFFIFLFLTKFILPPFFCHLLPYTYVLASPLLLQSSFICMPISLLLQRLLRGQGSQQTLVCLQPLLLPHP